MPTLHWIGKDKVINHHIDVPFKVLEHSYGFNNGTQTNTETQSGNKIIHGDNLEALKALLPEYEGKIKCIYIDPPYNTGNESWVYNDNVNDPKIKKWLGQVVGKEAEDLTRHDKWLCMMYPRLKLLHKLLADDGAIFISIDDNEQANLKLVCDEIFGGSNFVANIPWRKRTAKSDVPNGISQDYESILSYSKTSQFKAAAEGSERKYYLTEDFPDRPWRMHDLTTQRTAEERPNSFFTIVNQKNGKKYPANQLRTWAITEETYPAYFNADRIIFPNDYEFLKIKNPVLRYWKEDDIKKAGDNFGFVAMSTNLPKEVGMTQDGTKEITAIFGEKRFNFPKPSSLITYLIRSVTFNEKSAIILDSFAGSGTTAHAVLNLNKQDGGNRKFILIEMEDYAESITAERVKRVINGYGSTGSPTAEGMPIAIGSSFDFYELGQPLFNEDGNLNETVGVEKIRQYVWYSETKQSLNRDSSDLNTKNQYNQVNHKNQGSDSFLGKHNDTAYYFNYDKDQVTTLDHAFLATMKTKAEQYVIYADNCLLTKNFTTKHHIIFKKIPRDITRF